MCPRMDSTSIFNVGVFLRHHWYCCRLNFRKKKNNLCKRNFVSRENFIKYSILCFRAPQIYTAGKFWDLCTGTFLSINWLRFACFFLLVVSFIFYIRLPWMHSPALVPLNYLRSVFTFCAKGKILFLDLPD